MASDIEMHQTNALRLTTYLLLVSGMLMLLPYPLFYGLKAILLASGANSFSPGRAFMMFLVAGQLVLCLPLLAIPFSAFKLWRKTGSQAGHLHVLSRGIFRYAPALTLGFVSLIYTTKTENFIIPGAFGALLILYSCLLFRIDARASLGQEDEQ